MSNSKAFWIFLMIGSLIFSCNSPRRQKKINDGKLFEKLKDKKGYLNAFELKRLEQDFSFKGLDKYDLSGYDEEDTLAYFVRSGSYVWIASCYLGEDDNIPNPFFCLKESPEKGFDLILKGSVPALAYGECSYDLAKLLISKGDYVFVSQKSSGSSYCYDSPVIFHGNGKAVRTNGEIQIVTWNCPEENAFCFKRNFDFELDKSHLLIHVHEISYDWEAEQDVESKEYDLRFLLKNNSVTFQDTLHK